MSVHGRFPPAAAPCKAHDLNPARSVQTHFVRVASTGGAACAAPSDGAETMAALAGAQAGPRARIPRPCQIDRFTHLNEETGMCDILRDTRRRTSTRQ